MKKKISGQSFLFFNLSPLCFVEIWKIIPVFVQGKKGVVIKILEISKWVKSSVQTTASLGVVGKATGGF